MNNTPPIANLGINPRKPGSTTRISAEIAATVRPDRRLLAPRLKLSEVRLSDRQLT